MKTFAMAIAAAGFLATAAIPSTASAQVVIDTPGVDVRIGPNNPGYRQNNRVRRVYRGGRKCRTVTVREKRPNGTVVVRKRERC